MVNLLNLRFNDVGEQEDTIAWVETERVEDASDVTGDERAVNGISRYDGKTSWPRTRMRRRQNWQEPEGLEPLDQPSIAGGVLQVLISPVVRFLISLISLRWPPRFWRQ